MSLAVAETVSDSLRSLCRVVKKCLQTPYEESTASAGFSNLREKVRNSSKNASRVRTARDASCDLFSFSCTHLMSSLLSSTFHANHDSSEQWEHKNHLLLLKSVAFKKSQIWYWCDPERACLRHCSFHCPIAPSAMSQESR